MRWDVQGFSFVCRFAQNTHTPYIVDDAFYFRIFPLRFSLMNFLTLISFFSLASDSAFDLVLILAIKRSYLYTDIH